MSRSRLKSESAGGTMLPDIKVMNPPQDVNIVANHRKNDDQFRGFVGSSGPFHVTYTKSSRLGKVSSRCEEDIWVCRSYLRGSCQILHFLPCLPLASLHHLKHSEMSHSWSLVRAIRAKTYPRDLLRIGKDPSTVEQCHGHFLLHSKNADSKV